MCLVWYLIVLFPLSLCVSHSPKLRTFYFFYYGTTHKTIHYISLLVLYRRETQTCFFFGRFEMLDVIAVISDKKKYSNWCGHARHKEQILSILYLLLFGFYVCVYVSLVTYFNATFSLSFDKNPFEIQQKNFTNKPHFFLVNSYFFSCITG